MNTPSSSTSSLLAQKFTQPTTKNWEAAFGALSSQYGFSGAVPALPQKSTKPTKTPTQSAKSLSAPTRAPVTSQSSVPKPKKDYEAAFGQLSSSYGFGGGYSAAYASKK